MMGKEDVDRTKSAPKVGKRGGLLELSRAAGTVRVAETDHQFKAKEKGSEESLFLFNVMSK